MKSWHPKLKGKVAKDKIYTDEKLSPEIGEWLKNLKLLSGVPFGYLVPDLELLPEESIRFFYIDNNWINNMIDGACSIGRHHEEYSDDKRAIPYLKDDSYRTGFLLRSMLVEGWPGLEVIGYDICNKKISKERLMRLSPSILLCIFEGEISKVIIRKPAEALHFSFDFDEDKKSFIKIVIENEIKVEFRNSNRVININQLVDDISNASGASSADFACKMVDKGEEIVFKIKGPGECNNGKDVGANQN